MLEDELRNKFSEVIDNMEDIILYTIEENLLMAKSKLEKHRKMIDELEQEIEEFIYIGDKSE